jgi:hypothetical protein
VQNIIAFEVHLLQAKHLVLQKQINRSEVVYTKDITMQNYD